MNMPQLIDNRPEIELHGINAAGSPNFERIVFRVNRRCDLSLYAVILTLLSPTGPIPLRDNFYWFGTVYVDPGWIFLHTGPGENREINGYHGEKIYSWHWHKKETIFQNRSLTAMILRMDSFYVAPRSDEISHPSQVPGPLHHAWSPLAQP